MKRLWLFCFPLLFVPNLGFSQQTTFGVFEVSDWLIVPFLLLLMIAPSNKYEQRVSQLNPMLWGFLICALLSTLSIHFRYDYLDDVPILIGSCLKLARLVLYVIAGILITRKLSDPETRSMWLWSLLSALFMLSLGLLASRTDPGAQQVAQSSDSLSGYKSYNVIVVSVAILCSYIAGLWIDTVGSRRWNRLAGAGIVFAGCAVFLSSSLTSHGRGGWVAFGAGFGYILWKRTRAVRTLAVIFMLGSVSLTAYETLPTFKSLVDLTFSSAENSSSEPLDDGARLSSWSEEAPKFLNAPLLGTGFYHRGGNSGLWPNGSHNFFIQMFLETGIGGGLLVLLILAVAWQQAGLQVAVRNKVSIATRAALLTAFAGGMSGEYYYGGTGVLVLFAVLAIVGSMPIEQRVKRRAGAIDGLDMQTALGATAS
ncbi:MAG: O-antigen ligase family protein [Candidatus Sulfotelmatobacter sp.]|jgi:O-antigen ligase